MRAFFTVTFVLVFYYQFINCLGRGARVISECIPVLYQQLMPLIIFKKPRNRGTIPGKAKVFALPTVSSLALGPIHFLIH
jgi:hypothetical protein